MKKILSTLLLVFAMLLSACGGIKYEFKDGMEMEKKQQGHLNLNWENIK